MKISASTACSVKMMFDGDYQAAEIEAKNLLLTMGMEKAINLAQEKKIFHSQKDWDEKEWERYSHWATVAIILKNCKKK